VQANEFVHWWVVEREGTLERVICFGNWVLGAPAVYKLQIDFYRFLIIKIIAILHGSTQNITRLVCLLIAHVSDFLSHASWCCCCCLAHKQATRIESWFYNLISIRKLHERPAPGPIDFDVLAYAYKFHDYQNFLFYFMNLVGPHPINVLVGVCFPKHARTTANQFQR